MFKYLKYYLAILLCGAISLALLVMAFIAVLPKGTNDSFAVYEKVEVSSSLLDKEKKTYVSQITGIFINRGGEVANVERLEITVGDGSHRDRITLEGFSVPVRSQYDMPVYEWQGSYRYGRVHSVVAVVNGEELSLANRTANDAFDPSALLLLIPCLIAALVAVYAYKKYTYAKQEDQLLRELSSERE